jgi:hypothetical protein
MRRLARAYGTKDAVYGVSTFEFDGPVFVRELPLYFSSDDSDFSQNDTAWDADKIFGCECDSSWSVGIEAGQVQVPEWFGPDCSKRKFIPLS